MPVPVFVSDEIVTASKMNTIPRGVLGYAQVLANQATITTEVDLTGLSAVVSVEAGRRIRITGSVRTTGTVTQNVARLKIKETTTTLQTAEMEQNRTGSSESLEKSVVITPSGGSHTYKLTLEMSTGTGSISMVAGTGAVAFILVEDLGSV